MSKGPGIVQRAILDLLDDEWLSVDDVLTTLNSNFSRSERESVRRAMRTLAKRGVAELRHNARGELEITEAVEPYVQMLLERLHEMEAEGIEVWEWLKHEMEDVFKC